MEQMPTGQNLEIVNTFEKKFRYYMEDFDFSEEDLQKPLLDVGTNNGDFISYLRETLGNKKAVGLEYDKGKVREGTEGIVIGDGLSIPFEDASFEIVLAHNYLPMFVDNPEKMERAIQEMLRVAKTGGKIMGDISTPEGELEAKEELTRNLGNDHTEKMEAMSKKRYEGAVELQNFLIALAQEYKVEQIEKKDKNKRTILVISK